MSRILWEPDRSSLELDDVKIDLKLNIIAGIGRLITRCETRLFKGCLQDIRFTELEETVDRCLDPDDLTVSLFDRVRSLEQGYSPFTPHPDRTIEEDLAAEDDPQNPLGKFKYHLLDTFFRVNDDGEAMFATIDGKGVLHKNVDKMKKWFNENDEFLAVGFFVTLAA
ncbi:hypothetical protein DFH11DRAFT_1725721 [Phellopilus nigrolimitatus]|nr:hypothetical protein DFH11DRAFT_1725721 [Phellopilus nigrolimitatus]